MFTITFHLPAVSRFQCLFTQRRPEISGFLEIFGNPRS
ncbi:LysR family transcriptional regulator [Escherichia coli]|nr:LysR family transcriptional regulator [Escherichia coli]